MRTGDAGRRGAGLVGVDPGSGCAAARGRSARCRRWRSGSTGPGAAPAARRRAAYPRPVVVDQHQRVRRRRAARARPRRRSSAAVVGAVGQVGSVTAPSDVDPRVAVGAQQRRQAPLHRRGVRLAPERRPQLLQVVLGLVPERAAVAGVGGQAGVDQRRSRGGRRARPPRRRVQASAVSASLASETIR